MSSAKQYDLVTELREQLADALRDVEAANYLRDKHREESVQLRAQVAKLEIELHDALEMLEQAQQACLEHEIEIDGRDESEARRES